MASAAEQMAANMSWGAFGKAKELRIPTRETATRISISVKPADLVLAFCKFFMCSSDSFIFAYVHTDLMSIV